MPIRAILASSSFWQAAVAIRKTPVLATHCGGCSGAGLVTVAVPEEIYPIVAVKCDEAMPWPLPRIMKRSEKSI